MNNQNTKSLSDVLYEFSMEDRPVNAELLEEYVRKYTDFAGALTDFAVEIAIDKLRDSCSTAVNEADISEKTSVTVSKAVSRFHNQLHELSKAKAVKADAPMMKATATLNPIASLTPASFRGLRDALNVTTPFMIKLRDRLIEPATIPVRFLQRLAQEMQLSVDALRAHFAAPMNVQVAGQLYKSDEKPQAPKRQTFEEAVKSSNLSDDVQRDLLTP